MFNISDRACITKSRSINIVKLHWLYVETDLTEIKELPRFYRNRPSPLFAQSIRRNVCDPFCQVYPSKLDCMREESVSRECWDNITLLQQ